MNILFSMRHAGALRNFSSTLEMLAQRGHRVHLTFLTRDKLDDGRLLSGLLDRYPAITSGGVAGVQRSDWLGLARSARALADYTRYMEPEFATAHALRERAATRVPARLRPWLRLPLLQWRITRRAIAAVLASIERAVPPDAGVMSVIHAHRPDVLLLTPLVEFASDQIEYVKGAQRLGVRTGLCVHSWDNLTTKGLIRLLPDRIFVWNDAQRREAVSLHRATAGQVQVTGAPVYDQWFERRPTSSRAAFCSRAGLTDTRPFFLYLCSSPFIAPDEVSFITRWLAAVRSAADSDVRQTGILIRPHPSADPRIWAAFDPAAFENVVVWPAAGANPVDAASKDDYFDSMYHAAAAVGINTSAQIEAGIVGRRVYSVRVPECRGTQEETIHFQHLLQEGGGLLSMADTLDEHVSALGGALRAGASEASRVREFVRRFVRPAGLDVAATPQLVEAIEELGRQPAPAPRRQPLMFRLLRRALYPLATVLPAKPDKIRAVSRPAGTDADRRAGAGA